MDKQLDENKLDRQDILTDDQLSQVSKVLEENKNETDSLLEQIEKDHENDDNSNAPLEEGEGQYIGDGIIMGDGESNKMDFNHFDNIDSNLDDIIEENLKDNLSNNYNISDDEALTFANLILKVRKGENVDIFNNLPKELKEIIINMATEQNIPEDNKEQFLQYASKMFIDTMIKDAELNTLSIDLEKAMKELIPTPTEMYSETNKEYIENEFPKVAEKIKETDPKKAQHLLDMRQGFIDAYTCDPMFKLLDISKVLKNIRRSNKLWNRINNDYTQIAGVCKFNLYSLADLEFALTKINFSKEQARRIISLFVYTYINGIINRKDPDEYNDIYRNSFANYFEANVKNLAISPNLVSDFSKNIKDNLIKLSNHIDDLIAIREDELSNKKHKKRR